LQSWLPEREPGLSRGGAVECRAAAVGFGAAAARRAAGWRFAGTYIVASILQTHMLAFLLFHSEVSRRPNVPRYACQSYDVNTVSLTVPFKVAEIVH